MIKSLDNVDYKSTLSGYITKQNNVYNLTAAMAVIKFEFS